MRCPDCNGFRSYDTEAEPEADLTIDSEGGMSGSVTRDLPCSDCGTVLKSTEFNVDQDLTEILTLQPVGDVKPPELCTDGQEHTWDWENAPEASVSPTERLNDKDKNGNKIKLARFMTKFYGIEITGEVKCSNCGVTAVYEFSDEASAGSFDEQV